jgi:hypothetical protein
MVWVSLSGECDYGMPGYEPDLVQRLGSASAGGQATADGRAHPAWPGACNHATRPAIKALARGTDATAARHPRIAARPGDLP